MSTTSLRHLAAFTPVLALSLACLAPVEGDRAVTGDCPEGERCSAATPDGLVFVGQALYDGESIARLGPIAAGGTFDVGLQHNGAEPLAGFQPTTTNMAVFAAARGEGLFGPLSDGEPLYPVDAHVTLHAGTAGEASLRIVDAVTGELFDRTSFLVVDVQSVELQNVTAPERDHLLAGCEQMVGVRVLGERDGIEVRAFDDGMRVWADGTELVQETMFWDCVAVTPTATAREVRFDIEVGGARRQSVLPVHTLESEGLTACPARAD